MIIMILEAGTLKQPEEALVVTMHVEHSDDCVCMMNDFCRHLKLQVHSSSSYPCGFTFHVYVRSERRFAMSYSCGLSPIEASWRSKRCHRSLLLLLLGQ